MDVSDADSIVYHVDHLTFVYYLIIPHTDRTRFEVLLRKQDNDVWTLPAYTPVEHHLGVVKHINDYVWAAFQLDTATLRCFDSVVESERKLVVRYYVLDNLDPEWQPPQGFAWVNEADIRGTNLLNAAQRDIVLRWYDWWHSDSSARVGWMRPGWFSEVAYWMVDLADRMAMTDIQRPEQQRAWVRSALVTLQTAEDTLYLKATPDVFSYEAVITRVLAIRYPDNIPSVQAVHVENGWMLMKDFNGTPLTAIKDLDVWKRVLRDYAKIQMDMRNNTPSLITLGVPDRHLDYLSSQIERLLNRLPDALSDDEKKKLKRIAPTLRNMCFDLIEHRLPLTLIHGDFWAGNIVIDEDDNTVIYDWSDVAVSHPFFDIPFFLAELEQDFPDQPDAKTELVDAYLDIWTQYEPMPNLRRAYALAEVLSHLHMAVFYHNTILPNLEPNARWEMENMLPMMLRQVMLSVQTFQR